jgi:hypothetical protein
MAVTMSAVATDTRVKGLLIFPEPLFIAALFIDDIVRLPPVGSAKGSHQEKSLVYQPGV